MTPLERAAAIPNSVLLVTARAAHESSARRSYFFCHPEFTYTLQSLDDYPELLQLLDDAPQKGLYAAGYLSYECGYACEPSLLPLAPSAQSQVPLAWFGFYRQPLIFDYSPERHQEIQPPRSQFEITQEEYARKFEKVKSHIKKGDTYQVNLTTRLRLETEAAPADLFSQLIESQPVEFGAFINLDGTYILSVSPELFFRRLNSRITTRPMKGTAPRGLSVEEQQKNIAFLHADEKNRSENVMIVDLLRNDLRRVCQVNTVKVDELCAVEAFPTVLQMTSTVSGTLRPNVQYSDIFRSLFPCGSITGAPKVRTMQIIRELEDTPRGIYTGSIGFISPTHEAVFNVAIRTLVLRNGKGELGIGGGIVWDSDVLEEYEECQLKARFLERKSPQFQLIETILWEDAYSFLEEHLARLASSAQYFEYPCNLGEIRAQLSRLAASFPPSARRVRLLLDRDGGVQLSSQVMPPVAHGTSPQIVATVSERRTNANDLFLRHKTTHRRLYDEESTRASDAGYVDAVFFNNQGFLTEGAIHNIFIVKRGQWFTPPISDGLLPGVFRMVLLRLDKIKEQRLRREDLLSADEIYLGNSVRGLRNVDRIEECGQIIWEFNKK